MKRSTASSSLAANAYGVVKGRIVHGEVRPGQAISRRKLAAELGMSFLPVSMALFRLEYEGFIESRPRAGTRVRIPSPEDIRGHYVVREALEVQAAKLFVAAATPKEIEELRKLAVQVDGLLTGPDRTQRVRVHQKFHKRIADGARCPALSVTIEQVLALESPWLCAFQPQPHQALSRLHQELADVLAERDPERAAEEIGRHIAVGLKFLMEGLKPFFAERQKSSKTFVRSAATAT